MSRNALRLYKTAEFARIDVKISLTYRCYVLFHHPILHAVALPHSRGYDSFFVTAQASEHQSLCRVAPK
ncbi:MAG TPA: hypothetical protein PK299_16025 [Anaerolineales bacterium]|nr:hypothetical protein [Anaerolineales bacterium]